MKITKQPKQGPTTVYAGSLSNADNQAALDGFRSLYLCGDNSSSEEFVIRISPGLGYAHLKCGDLSQVKDAIKVRIVEIIVEEL